MFEECCRVATFLASISGSACIAVIRAAFGNTLLRGRAKQFRSRGRKYSPCPGRKPVESASRSGTALSTRPSVLLHARGTQTGDPVRLERSLPGNKLLLRQLVAPQNLFHRDLA